MSWPTWVWMALYFTITLIFEVGFILLVMKTRFRSRDVSPPADEFAPNSDREPIIAVKWESLDQPPSSDISIDKGNHGKRKQHPA